MKELARHIEVTLLNNDCVIVPRLGGFVAHYVPAKFNEEENLYLPPTRTVGFNPQLTINDSLLAQSYAEAYDISIPEAIERIEKAVDNIKYQLDNTGKYQIHGVGILSINKEGKTEFIPNKAGILSPKLYALDAFKIKPMQVVNTNGQLDDTQNETKGAKIVNFEKPAPKTVTVKVSTLRNALLAAIALFAIIFFTKPLGSAKQETIMSGAIQNMMPKSITIGKADIEEKINIPFAINKETKNKKQAETKVIDETTYCIVLASGTMKKNAKLFTEYMHKNGFTETRLFQDKNDLKVVYGHYKTQNEAYSALKQLSGNKDFKQGWIKKIEQQ